MNFGVHSADPRLSGIGRLVPVAVAVFILQAPVSAGEATLYRDQWGVPHIWADDYKSAGYAVGQAQCEDSLKNTIRCLYTGVGRLAELNGASFLKLDVEARQCRHAVFAESAWPNLNPRVRELVEGYCEGINNYLAVHPDEYGRPIAAITPVHVLAWYRAMLMRSTIRIARADAEASKSDGYHPDYNPKGVTGDAGSRDVGSHPGIEPGKSNSWALAGSRTASGKPIVLIDPHFATDGHLQLYEMWLHVADELHAGGFAIPATPLPGLGVSQFAAWAFTSGGADSSDAFALTINPDNPLQYQFDDSWEDMDVRRETIRVRQDDGSFSEESIVALETRHGPVLETKGGVLFAAAMGGYKRADQIEQFFEMATAQTTDDFRAALELNRLEYFNITWATAAGDIGYVQTGQAPLRSPMFGWSRMVPGWTSDSAYERTLSLAEHPHVENPVTGFLQNCNVGANVVTPGLALTRSDFPPGVLWGHYGQYRARGSRATRLLTETHQATLDDAQRIAFDTYVLPADLWIPVILQAYAEAQSESSQDTSKQMEDAVRLLGQWNRRATRESAAATLFRFWRLECDALETPAGRDRFQIPNTPEIRRDSLVALEKAVARLQEIYGRIDVPWGEIKRLRRGDREWPLSGDGLGQRGMDALRATAADKFNDENRLIMNGGQCVTSVVELTNPPRIRTVVAYGQSNKRDSPHFDDQAPLYSNEQMRDVPWTLKQLTPHIESQIVVTVD